MRVYFYCSYAHSSRGFYMTRLEGTGLAAQEEDDLPGLVSDFFSFARFRFLWRELGERGGAFLGIREIHGTLRDGRSAVMNLAVLGDSDEITLIRRTAFTLLSDFPAFEQQMISRMKVGGPCGYEIDGADFSSWMQNCAGHNVLRRTAGAAIPAALLRHLTREPQREPDLIRLAACCYDWERLRGYFGDGPEWQVKPPGICSAKEFTEMFCKGTRPWSMSSDPEADPA